MNIVITIYEDWMKPQIAKLFSEQYNVTENYFAELMENFYDHPFQKQKCIRIAALDGEKVVGFQSFFYWPYFLEGKKLNSFQSGNSLVHPEYRGQQIFQRLLEFFDQHREKIGIDFLIGFPIIASRNSLLKNKWKNPFDLQWYIRPMNFFAMLTSNERKTLPKFFKTKSENTIRQFSNDRLRLSDENDFREWRNFYSKQETYYYYIYSKQGKSIEFVMKCIRRKKIIRELIIGDVRSETRAEEFLYEAFLDLLKTVRKSGCISLVSFAKNPFDNFIPENILLQNNFRKINRVIFFCNKSFTENSILAKPESWIIFRSDIDTW